MSYAVQADSLQSKKTIFNLSRSRTAAWSLYSAGIMHCHHAGWGKGYSSTLSVTACTRKPRLRVAFPPFFFSSCFSEMGFPHAAHASVKLLGTRDPGPSASSFLPLKTSSAITKQQKKTKLSSKASLDSSLHQASGRCLLPLLPQLTEKMEERLGQRDWGRGFLMARCVL